MMDAIKTFKVGNKTVKIYQDDDTISPRDPEYQDVGDTMICFHKRYNLGDKHDYKSEDYGGWASLLSQIIKDLKPVEIRPLYMYDHSGLTIACTPFSCPWDSGQIGFILITPKQVKDNFGVKRITKKVKEQASKALDASIKEYDQYLRGEVYGYVVEDEDGESVESCWGFIGDMEYCEKEAKSMAEGIVKREQESIINPAV